MSKIPVVLQRRGDLVLVAADDARIALQPAIHDHSGGDDCPACAAIGDIRVQLYELLERRKLGAVPPFARVVVDATRIGDLQPTIDRLTGKAPAGALRDHVVARNFELAP